MLTRFLICTFLLLSLCSTALAQSLDKAVFITEHLPPYNYMEDKKIQGISVDVLRAALAAVDIQLDKTQLHIYPWARGYKTALQTPNTCLFSTARNDFREKSFKWAGPIANATFSFYTQNINIKADSINDLKKYNITTARQGIGHYTLQENKFPEPRTDLSTKTSMMLDKLIRGRVDLVLENKNVMRYTVKKEGMDWSKFINVYTVNLGEIYFAFNKDTPDHVVQRLQKGINIIKENGKLESLVNKLHTRPE
ncbi:substrate-binding periplasmic protein [Maridesulfovibrio sp.]|uniref:substrate-binding periplasmic protein n=2 Tax=Maridesulfovibrio TaxID=2794998 RepID=UPI003B00D227